MQKFLLMLLCVMLSSPSYSDRDSSMRDLLKCVSNYEVFRHLQQEISEKDYEISALYGSVDMLLREKNRSKLVGEDYPKIDQQIRALVDEMVGLIAVRTRLYSRVNEAEVTITLCRSNKFKKRHIKSFCNLKEHRTKHWCKVQF